ncbi:MAG: TldD/PmbA family protein [Chloroflexi bacterium]|nr:MAG: TldD/PmbA family protein [Chloroflexota bacterium]
MRDRLTTALKSHNVDYADIRLEDKTDSWVNFRGPDLDSVGSSRVTGGIVRALYKGGWGYATFNNLDDLEKQVRDACETARLIGSSKTLLAEAQPVVDEITAVMDKDFREIPLKEKKAQVEEYNKIALGYHESIQATRTLYSDSFKKIWYANSEGTYIQDEQPNIVISVQATARKDDIVQSVHESAGGPEGYAAVENFHEKAANAARRAVELLSAAPVRGGKYTVITNPEMTGVFTHEAFGHLSESDFVYENEQMKALMKIGKRFGSDNLNIVDDGSLPGGLGTHPYDYEGVRTRKNYLVKDGILVGRLHSRETAAKMGEEPTGNARAVFFQHPPIVRMTNTFIEPGTTKADDIFKDIKLGVYAFSVIGGQTAMEMFTFSAAYGYMIRDGQVAEMVRDVVLTGNVFDTLMNIDAIGDDLRFAPNGPGGCGKGEQHPLRVGLGGPHIRIQNCVVGGGQS